MKRCSVLFAVLCTACSALGFGRPELAIYGVHAIAADIDGAPVVWQLLVDEPIAPDPLSGARIVLAPGGNAYGVFRGARWRDRAPEMVQALLIQSLEDSGRIIGVGRTSASVRGDYALIAELRDFQAEYPTPGSGEVAVTLSVKLVRYASSEVVAARVFSQRVTVTGSGVDAVVAAFETALGEAVPAIVRWTFEVGEANWQASYPRAQ